MIKSHFGGVFGLSLVGIAMIAMLFIVRYESSLKKQVSGRFTQPSPPPADTTNKLLSEDQPWNAMSVVGH
ncbi:MAG: hypothetical protein J2P21_30745, partial [Chloracidobacterium sp.]|nr:hypothetical protein [Chloracidobacterium sp.]